MGSSDEESWVSCPAITFIVSCVVLFLLSGWYWYYLFIASDSNDATAIVIYIISGALLVIFAIIGVVATVRQYESLLTYFGIVMVVMFIFGVAQLVLAGLALRNCDEERNPFQFVCELNDDDSLLQFWLPSGTILAGNIFALVFGCIVRRKVKKADDRDNYY